MSEDPKSTSPRGPGDAHATNGRKGRVPGAPREVKCPQCGQATPYEGNAWRPFCSERCKMVDLGAWAEGRYAIPSEDTPGSDEGEG